MSPTVAVCRKCEHHEHLERALTDRRGLAVELVRCQKICRGPVAGLVVDGRMEWFECLDGRKAIAAFVDLARTGASDRLPKPLRRRRVPKRAGRLRR